MIRESFFFIFGKQGRHSLHVACGRQVPLGIARPDHSFVGLAPSSLHGEQRSDSARPLALVTILIPLSLAGLDESDRPTSGQLRSRGPHLCRRHQLGHDQTLRSALVREGCCGYDRPSLFSSLAHFVFWLQRDHSPTSKFPKTCATRTSSGQASSSARTARPSWSPPTARSSRSSTPTTAT